MSETVFTKVDYDLGGLVKFIGLGEIGLPDIQRPFVWKNAKVRDLFDSMYKGYPVGYLLFWQNGLADDRTIGTDQKQKPPRLVIVDGQQRMTSLYAVIKGVNVVRENYDNEKICIAFNPLEERFEVADAAIRRDKAYIPDISILWSGDIKITKIIREHIANLKTSRDISEDQESVIEDSILKLQSLLTFPFTALELASNISEEDVSDVFVRINSKGTPLNQADFILTLMSVFWDEGRSELEHFCRLAKKPAKGTASPFNYFIEPSPDQLLRVDVGVAFKRARLKYVYSILRGKDLETETFSDKRRVEQFEVFKNAQKRTLNLQYWHDFMNCIRQAGFRSGKMISSQNNFLFSYILYLIGRTEPDNWEHLEYREFLEKRRELMAQVIAEAYATLIASEIEQDAGAGAFDLSQVVINGESEAVELKSTIRTNLHTGTKDPRMELAVLKTLAGFLNTNGGTLIVGVSDDGSPVGIETDGFPNEDKMGLHLVNIVKSRMGIQAMTSLHAHFDDHDDCRVMVVKCRRAPSPVFVKDGETERFYIRTGPSTTELSASQTQEYVKRKFKG